MSDSDMDIDDDDVQPQDIHTIAGVSQLLHTPIQASDSLTDVKKHLTTPISGLNDMAFVQPHISGNIGMNTIKLQDGKGSTLSRFPVPGPGITAKSFPSWKEPEQKRAALPCKFFAKGRCANGNSCRFLHVKENSNHPGQQLAQRNMAGSSDIHSVEGKRILDNKDGVRVSLFGENGVTSLHRREDISLVNLPGSQIVFPFKNEMRFMSPPEIMGGESLKQKCGANVTENRSMLINNSNSFALRSSLVHDQISSITSYRKTDPETSGPAWTGSLFSSVPMNASTLGHLENMKNTNGSGSGSGSGSLPTLHATSVSSNQDAEDNTTSNKEKVPSNDWEPSEPFQASFTIPPYILPSADALYDPFTDIENLEDRSRNSQQTRKNTHPQKDADSASGPQARDSNNDDKNSSCSQNQQQGAVARKNLEADRVVEGVATSVVDQNDTTTSKEVSSAAAAENRVVLKRIKPAGHDSWHRSDGSSYKKTLRSDEIDGEVRSDAGMKVMRQFRTAVVETIKEMLKPLWREGRLTKEAHNMIVKKASEKVVSGAVQFHQVPTDTESIDQYLSSSATKIVKLVEGYVEKYGKH